MLLTVSFGEHHLPIFGGQVWFGVRGGELALQPSAGKFLPDRFWPDNALGAEVKVKRTLGAEQRDKRHRSLNAKAKLTGATADASATSDRDAETATTVADEFEHIHWRIAAHGPPSRPLWKFEAAAGEPCLKGRLARQEIGQLGETDRVAGLKATFSVFKKDIRLLAAEGLWPEDISKTKHAVLMALLRTIVAARMGSVVCDLALAPPTTEAA